MNERHELSALLERLNEVASQIESARSQLREMSAWRISQTYAQIADGDHDELKERIELKVYQLHSFGYGVSSDATRLATIMGVDAMFMES